MLRTCFDYIATEMGLSSVEKDATFYPDDIAQRRIAQARGDNSLEFMNLWRGPPNLNHDRFNSAMGMRNKGITYVNPNDPSMVGIVDAVPVVLPYKVRVWSKSLEIINKVAENWLYWPLRTPTTGLVATVLGVDIPIRGDLYVKELTDGSQVIEQFADGRYYSISLSVDLKANIYRVIPVAPLEKIVVNLYYSVNPAQSIKTELLRTWEIGSG